MLKEKTRKENCLPIGGSSFPHLRVHTEFSIIDGIVAIEPLMRQLLVQKMPSVAITDIANLFGFIKFYKAAIASGIKPLCGAEVLVADKQNGASTKLVLLAKDKRGYQNLTRLLSDFYVIDRGDASLSIDQHNLSGYTDGLIALSGAQQSDIGVTLLSGDLKAAENALARWMNLFPQSFYLEVQRVGRQNEATYISRAIELAAKVGCPIVATNDVRFLNHADYEAHEVRVCINEKRNLDDPRRKRENTDQQYLKTADEMLALFPDLPEALINASEIAKRCNLLLDIGTPKLPNYPVPDGKTLEEYFVEVSRQGLRERLLSLFGEGDPDSSRAKPYWDRLDFELDVIKDMGFTGYFLIVMEFIQWSRDNGIPVGPGRGSGAGSIVAYALKITDLDPLEYDLLFERFLNPERVSMPDFDVDFCIEGRDRVIQHVSDLYGKEAVAQIITFGTMAAKAVIRDVARVQGHPYALADKLSKLIPFVPGITLKEALDSTPELSQFIEEDVDAQEIMEMAFALEGLTRNVGKHAGGVVIAQTKLTDFSPLYRDPNGESVVTQFDKDDAETVGLVKFDFLGLRTLTIIDSALRMINSSLEEEHVSLESLPLDDASVYELLQRGETTAVFQLESRGMKDLIKRQMPNCFADVIALVALFRPGPLESGMVDDFVDRKHGRTQVVFPHPELEPVLADTYGVILYQEQVMKIAQVLGNYTLGAADILRKAMGKKDPKEMARQRSLFTGGAVKRGVDKKVAESIFDLMEKFAGYGFNKSHSAAYALVSYQTAWLKTHYPAYFMAAVLSAEMQNTDKIVTLIDECNALGIAIIPPDVNMGEFLFTVNREGQIVYGLGSIRGLGEAPVTAILDSRSQGPYKSMLDICQRVDSQQLNRRTLEALVNAGALDNLVEGSVDYSRAALTDLLPQAMQAAAQENRNLESGVEDLFGEIVPEGTSNCAQATDHLEIREWDEQVRLKAEKEALGLYLSGHPIDAFLSELRSITAGRLKSLRPDRGTKLIGGLLASLRTSRNKSGEAIAFLTIDDRSARVEISLFAKEYELFRDQLRVDEIFILECGISIDERNGGIKGRAKTLMTLSEARCSRANRLLLNLDETCLLPNFCNDLAATLEPYRLQRAFGTFETDLKTKSSETGEGCRVAVNYLREASRGCIMFGHEWTVLPSDDLIQRLRRNYGRENVLVEY